jgi:hypothetical protein
MKRIIFATALLILLSSLPLFAQECFVSEHSDQSACFINRHCAKSMYIPNAAV